MKTGRIFLLVLSLILGSFSGAFAEGQQDELVVDNANLFGEKLKDVEAAVRNLQSKGADVHVWTIKSFAGEASSLEGYEKKLEKNFPAWQSASGKRKNNLVVLMTSMKEKKTGLYYGSEWNRPLEKNWLRISTDLMNPKFKRGEFAEGFVVGLGEITRLVDEHIHPAQTAPPAQTVVVQQQAPSKPTDLSGLWAVMGWGLGLTAIFVAGFLVFQALRRRREEKEIRGRAQQKAKIEKGNATEKITSIRSSVNNLETLISAISGMMDEESAKALKAKFQKVKDAQGKLAADFAGTGNAAGDPDADGLMESQYAAMEDKYKEVTISSGSVLSAISVLEAEVRSFRDQAMNAPKTLNVLNQRAKEVENVILAMKNKGFKIEEVSGIFDDAMKLLSRIQNSLNEKRYVEFNASVQKLELQLNSIEEDALSLLEIKEEIEKNAVALEAKIPAIVDMVSEAKKVFTLVVKSFIPRSCESIKGNGSEAENRIKKVTAAIETIRKCASMEVQDWSQGQALAENAARWLDEAESLLHAVFALRDNLERAKVDVVKEVADVKSDIQKARDYIKTHDADIADGLQNDLQKAEDMIKDVEAELAKPLPDYTSALKQAQETNRLVDKIYDQAVDERETAERQRRKLTSQQHNSDRKISKAKEYIGNHSADVNSDARDHLQSAEMNFQKAASSNNLDQKLKFMLMAEEAADNAYNVAKDDVDSAHRDRNRNSWGSRREYVSQDTTIIVAGGFHDHHNDDNRVQSSGWNTSRDEEQSSGGGGSVSFDSDDSDEDSKKSGGGDVDFGSSSDNDSDGGGGDTGW